MENVAEIGKYAALLVTLLLSIIGITTDFRVQKGKKKVLTRSGYAAILITILSVGIAAYLSVVEQQIAKNNAIKRQKEEEFLRQKQSLVQWLQNEVLHSIDFKWTFYNSDLIVIERLKSISHDNPHDGLEDLTIRMDPDAQRRYEALYRAERMFYGTLSYIDGSDQDTNILSVNFGNDRVFSIVFGIIYEDAGSFENIEEWEGVFHFTDWPNILDEPGWPYPDASATYHDRSVTLEFSLNASHFENAWIPASERVNPNSFLPAEVEIVFYSAQLDNLPFSKSEREIYDPVSLFSLHDNMDELTDRPLNVSPTSTLNISVNGGAAEFSYKMIYEPQKIREVAGGIGDPYLQLWPPRWKGTLESISRPGLHLPY